MFTEWLKQRRRRSAVKAFFEEGGIIHIQTKWEAVLEWFQNKWQRFGSI